MNSFFRKSVVPAGDITVKIKIVITTFVRAQHNGSQMVRMSCDQQSLIRITVAKMQHINDT